MLMVQVTKDVPLWSHYGLWPMALYVVSLIPLTFSGQNVCI